MPPQLLSPHRIYFFRLEASRYSYIVIQNTAPKKTEHSDDIGGTEVLYVAQYLGGLGWEELVQRDHPVT